MDEAKFQAELLALKQRLALLGSQSAKNLEPLSPFDRQLYEVKAQLASMQDRFTAYHDSMARPVSLPGISSLLPSQDNLNTPQEPNGLYPELSVWGELDNMRGHVVSLNDRLSTFEATISELEDRVDCMDFNRFTPVASSVGSELAFGASIEHKAAHRRTKSAVAELCSEAEVPTSNSMLETNHADFRQNCGDDIPPWGWQGQYSEQYPASYGVPLQTTRNPRKNTHIILSAISRLERQNDWIMQRFMTLENVAVGSTDGYQAPVLQNVPIHRPQNHMSELAAGAQSHAFHGSPESVAFRDRESSRLDEQLRIAQDRLRTCETQVSAGEDRNVQLERENCYFRTECTRLGSQIHELEGQANWYEQRFNSTESFIEHLQDELTTSHESLHRSEADYKLLELSHQTSERLAKRNGELQKELARQASENDRMLHDYNTRMKKLLEFCEHKDVIINRQERIISRSAYMLQGRDAEVERLQRRLDLVGEGRDRVAHSGSRMMRALEEGDVQRSRSPYSEATWRDEWEDDTTKDHIPNVDAAFEDRERMVSPDSTRAARRIQQDLFEPMQDSASDITNVFWRNEERPPLQRRPTRDSDADYSSQSSPLLWHADVSPATAVYRSVQPSPDFTSPRTALPSYPPRSAVNDNSVDYKANVGGRHRKHGPRNDARHPSATRRMASESNLRAPVSIPVTSPTAPHQTLKKHQSAQGLGGNRWQAYVESDDEIGRGEGGFGGEV